MCTPEQLAAKAELTWFDYQERAFEEWSSQSAPQRMLLFYRTGAGKTITSLALLRLAGHTHALVVAPPATHADWKKAAERMGCFIDTISHAKFRMAAFKPSRHTAIIADEFHLFGGHKGIGWRKMNLVGRALQAPLILASATPNYNDAERVYCIQSVLDPMSVHGGYLQFLYQNCQTEQNPFGTEPTVTGFLRFNDAAEYLSSLKHVVYVPDNVTIEPIDVTFQYGLPEDYEEYGLDREKGRIIASQMEERHRTNYLYRVEGGRIRADIIDVLEAYVLDQPTPVLVFSNSAVLAEMLNTAVAHRGIPTELITGRTRKKRKDEIIEEFRQGKHKVLVGTASLATGVDGLDKTCNSLVIFDDTDDNALRRQLMGRILPRGADSDASHKEVIRYCFI